MPWAFVSLSFCLNLIVWIVFGFFKVKYSLTYTFFPYFFAILIFSFFHRFAVKREQLWLSNIEKLFVITLTIIIMLIISTWSINSIIHEMPLDVKIFNLVVPLIVFVMQLAVWLSKVSDKSFKHYLVVLFAIFAIDAVISLFVFFGANILHVLPTEIFYSNTNYPVILYGMRGQTWIRTPGIFESGGTHGSFLIIILSLILSYLLLNKGGKINKSYLSLAMLLAIMLIMSTLTRRSILGVFVLFLVAMAVLTVKIRKGNILLFIFPLFLGCGFFLIHTFAPELFRRESLNARMFFWLDNINRILANNMGSFLVGYGITQSSLQFIGFEYFALIDNGYLAMIVYGGLLFLVLIVLYYLVLLFTNMKLLERIEYQYKWLAMSNIIMIINIFVFLVFSPFYTNLTESFLYFLTVNLITKYLLLKTKRQPIVASGKLGSSPPI